MTHHDPKSEAGVLAVIALSVAAVATFTIGFEGEVYKAYVDDTGHVSICNGHAEGVHLGDVASKETCRHYYQKDMTKAMSFVKNPELLKYTPGLQAAGDFTLNAGIGAWEGSPMSVYFAAGDIKKACESFTGYWVWGTYDRPKKGAYCKPKPGTTKYYCQISNLIERRVGETDLCFGTYWEPDFSKQ